MNLLSNRLLARNVIWNLTGTVIPLLFAIWAIPNLISGMGNDRFGLLGIVWAGIGYFSLFDLGMGVALAKLTAEHLGNGLTESLPILLKTGLRLLLGLGVFAMLCLSLLTPLLTDFVFSIPTELKGEAESSLWILAATLPFVTMTSGLTGILRAYQRFDQINAVRIPLGIANFLFPVLALKFTPSLVATTALLALSRILSWIACLYFCRPYLSVNREACTFDRNTVKILIGFGGWLTISNIVGPIMVYFDRFLIGAIAGMAAVAYYTTPYEIVTRLWIVPDALIGVLFTAFTTAFASDATQARPLVVAATRIFAVCIGIPTVFVFLFAHEGISFWLGPNFAIESAGVLRWLAIGVFINCFARLPFSIIQAAGRPDLTAKLHLVELPFYLILLWLLTDWCGVLGTAAAWTLRITGDTIVLFIIGQRLVPELASEQKRSLAIAIPGALLIAGTALLSGPTMKACVAGITASSGLVFLAINSKGIRNVLFANKALTKE